MASPGECDKRGTRKSHSGRTRGLGRFVIASTGECPWLPMIAVAAPYRERMTVRSAVVGDELLLLVDGTVDGAVAPELHRQLSAADHLAVGSVVVDLAEAPHIDDGGIADSPRRLTCWAPEPSRCGFTCRTAARCASPMRPRCARCCQPTVRRSPPDAGRVCVLGQRRSSPTASRSTGGPVSHERALVAVTRVRPGPGRTSNTRVRPAPGAPGSPPAGCSRTAAAPLASTVHW